jgi:glycyl-tRNA synthetase
MEIEYFVENDEQKALAAQAMWQDLSKQFWLDIIKLNPENIRFREQEKDELAHYAKKTFDVEYKFPR